jgi:hypothetical protein
MRRKAETISGYFSSLARYIGIGDCAQQPLIRPNNNIPALNLWLTVMLKGTELSLMCYPGGGTVDGVKGDHVLLTPPFNINSAHVEEIVEKLARTFNSVFNHV